jgi:hypothetical protein
MGYILKEAFTMPPNCGGYDVRVDSISSFATYLLENMCKTRGG